MNWNAEMQQRFDTLRARELTGSLTDDEQRELDAFVSSVYADEAQYLAPVIAQLDQNLRDRETQLAMAQQRNEHLAALVR